MLSKWLVATTSVSIDDNISLIAEGSIQQSWNRVFITITKNPLNYLSS